MNPNFWEWTPADRKRVEKEAKLLRAIAEAPAPSHGLTAVWREMAVAFLLCSALDFLRRLIRLK